MSVEEIYAMIQYQVAAVKGMTEAAGGQLHHVKPHGALYNMAAKEGRIADAIVRAILSIDDSLLLYGPPGSELTGKAAALGLTFRNEVFADRNYNDDLSLVSRNEPDAQIRDVALMFDHVKRMLLDGKVKTVSGAKKSIEAHTICIHGDKPDAGEVARFLSEKLKETGIRIG